jgi:hypothetical protein
MFGGDIYFKLENLQKTGLSRSEGATYGIMKNVKISAPAV